MKRLAVFGIAVAGEGRLALHVEEGTRGLISSLVIPGASLRDALFAEDQIAVGVLILCRNDVSQGVIVAMKGGKTVGAIEGFVVRADQRLADDVVMWAVRQRHGSNAIFLGKLVAVRIDLRGAQDKALSRIGDVLPVATIKIVLRCAVVVLIAPLDRESAIVEGQLMAGNIALDVYALLARRRWI